MKKVSAREFQHHFGKVAASLKPGEAVQITRNGHVDGIYQKTVPRQVPFPDFKKRLEEHGYSAEVGEALLNTLDGSVS
jgi:hypothetical protein